jgi:mannose-6-phosphate isomerase
LLGDLPVDGGFPLLYKFIAAREKLSVQVHPGAGSPMGEPKTECWYVVEAAPGAELIVGVAPEGRDREETLELLKSPRCEAILSRLPARRGDVFFIPAGTVHAITEGLLLYEVQQNSDTTYRLYDWGRVDAAGKPRAMHLAEAGAVADLGARAGYRIDPLSVAGGTHAEDFLVACPYFALVRWRDFAGSARLKTHGRFRVVTQTAGTAELRGADGSVLTLQTGETALVPACHDAAVVTAESPDAELIVSFVPDLERDVRAPLRAAGHPDEAIARLFGPDLGPAGAV